MNTTRSTIALTGEVYLGSKAIQQTPGRFGVEIEMIYGTMTRRTMSGVVEVLRAAGIDARGESYNHRASPCWKVTTDASVSAGCEVVSPILSGEAGMAELARVCQALSTAGAGVDKTTGLHLHLDATGWKLEDFRLVLKAFCSNERALDMLVAPSRRGSTNQYCKSVLASVGSLHLGSYDPNALVNGTDPIEFLRRAYERIDGCHSIRQVRGLLNYDRYHKLNLESLDRHTTIEFRQHQGSLNAEKILRWVRLLTGLVLKARCGGLKRQKHDRTAMAAAIFRLNRMSGGGRETYEWMVRRAKELAKSEGRKQRRTTQPTTPAPAAPAQTAPAQVPAQLPVTLCIAENRACGRLATHCSTAGNHYCGSHNIMSDTPLVQPQVVYS